MNKEQAIRLVSRLRKWAKWRTLPQSDVVLLRSQAEAHENVSFIMAVMLFSFVGYHRGCSWSDVWLVLILAFIVYSRIEAGRFRAALRLFEAQGIQMVGELKE